MTKDKPYMIPDSWTWCSIDEITSKVTDGSHNPPRNELKGIPMLSAKNVNNNYIDFNDVRYITEEAFIYENERTNIEPGDILLTIVATIGRTAIIPETLKKKFAIQRSVALIKPIIVPGRYLMYFFQSPYFQKTLTNEAKGTAQKGVYLGTLKTLKIPVAPLAEQKRIVSKIEEIFSELDSVEISLQRSKKMLKSYKHQCLKEAFAGKFTKNWRKNQSKSNSNFASQEIVDLKDSTILPDGWYISKIKDVALIIMGQSPKGSSYNFKGIGTPLVNGPAEFGPTQFSYTLIQKWTTEPIKTCETGDLILCVRGSTTGRQNIAGTVVCLGRGVAAIRAIHIEQTFLNHYFNFSTKNIYDLGTGTTFPNVSQEQLLSFPIPIMSIEEQKHIVQEIEYRLTIVDDVEKAIERHLLKTNTYRQTILNKAFNGALVPRVMSDELAEVLLNKIKMAKEIKIAEITNKKKHTHHPKKFKKTLIEVLRNTFKDKDFTYEEMRDSIELPYDDIKDQLFKLLETQKQVTSKFNVEKEIITFKLIS